MSLVLDVPSVETVRRAEGQQADALRNEAARWARARHPGVAEVVAVSDAGGAVSVTIREPGGPALAEVALDGTETVGALAIVATTVADLHDIGVAVGGLGPATIKLAPDGRPVLCDLSGGALLAGPPSGWARSPAARHDVIELGRLAAAVASTLDPSDEAIGVLSWLADAPESRMLGRRPTWLRLATSRNRTATPDTARRFADALVDHVPGARLPGAEPSSNASQDTEPRYHAVSEGIAVPWAGALITTLFMATAWWWFAPAPRHHAATSAAARSASIVPARVGGTRRDQLATPSRATATDGPVLFAGGVLHFGGKQYQVGEAGDVLAAGRWMCGTVRTLALLRPSSGEVFVFTAWPGPDAPITARAIGRAPGATALAPIPDGACDGLSVVGPGSQAVTLRPWTNA